MSLGQQRQPDRDPGKRENVEGGSLYFLYFGTAQQIVQPTNSKPAISKGFEHDAVVSTFVRLAVLFGQQIDKPIPLAGAFCGKPETDLLWLGA